MSAAKTESGKRAIDLGSELGCSLIPVTKVIAVEGNDRVLFWAGFLGAIYGQMAADIGRQASNAVIESVSSVLPNVALGDIQH